jgi:hypothetical protein
MQSTSKHKRYPIHQSPLYRIKGRGQFQSVLNVNWNDSKKLLSSDNYKVWINDDGREIQKPIRWLNAVHLRLGKLLSRIELPDYLYSQKGKSYADNARAHIGDTPLVKTDINKFFPSTSWQMVYKLFKEDFKCASDVSHVLADICCYEQAYLPTGSPISGRVSFFAAKHMFDELAKLASAHNCTITVYVDDVTLSGEKATKTLLGEARKIISKYGYKTKQRKSRTYASKKPKPVTGAIVATDNLRLPNNRHKKIWETRNMLKTADPTEKHQLQLSLRGRLQEAKQITSKEED